MRIELALLVFALVGSPCDAASFIALAIGDSVDAAPGDGQCANAEGQCSLRAAVMEANALEGADTINLQAGTYVLSLPGVDDDASLSGDLDVTDDLSVLGAGPELSIIDGGALDRVVDLRAASNRSVEMSGLALTNGFLQSGTLSTAGGAGLLVGTGVTVTLHRVTIRENRLTMHPGAAAGLHNLGCVQGTRVRIVDNVDTAGISFGFARSGGIYTSGVNSCLVLEDSEISRNLGDQTGGLYVNGDASVTLRRTLLAGNESKGAGAALLNVGDIVLLENVTISGNAGNPGGVLNDGGTRLILIHSTVTGNHASNNGATVGGLDDVNGGVGLTFLSNTVVAGNGPGSFADDCAGATSVSGGNIIGNSTGCDFAADSTDQLDVDPGLGPLAENGGFTRSHLPGPNAIDHATSATCLDTDQRGTLRPLDGDGDGMAACDVGAVELDLDTIFGGGFELL